MLAREFGRRKGENNRCLFFRLQSNLSSTEKEDEKASIVESIGKCREILEEETKVGVGKIVASLYEKFLK